MGRVGGHGAVSRAWVLVAAVGCAAPQKSTAPSPPPPRIEAGPAVFRRLTLFEHRNTIRDLLGAQASAEVPVDTASGRSGYPMGGSVSWVGSGYLLEDAERLARAALEKNGALLPCDPVPAREIAQRHCVEQLITRFGRRAYRRPLSAAEAQSLVDLYLEQRITVGQDFMGAVRVVVTAMLMSPPSERVRSRQ